MGDVFDESAHWSERATCRCHYYRKYMVFVNVILRELLIIAVVEINTGDRQSLGRHAMIYVRPM